MAGLTFEEGSDTGAPLDEVLRDATASGPESLPLLEFALEELYQRRSPDGRLTCAAYSEVGGVEGALAQRAEAVYASLAPEVQAAFPRVVRALVSVGAGDAVVRQQAAYGVVTATPHSRTLVEAFVQARLFSADRIAQGQAGVRVAHEALLRHWPRVVDWLEQNRELLIVHARVRLTAARWAADGKPADLLLGEGKPLAEAEYLAAALGDDLADAERALIAASRTRSTRRRVIRRTATASLAVLTLAAVLASVYARRQEGRARLAEQDVRREQQATLEQKRRADALVVKQRNSLGDLAVNSALREWNEGDPAVAMLWQARALKTLNAEDEPAMRMYRIRFASLLSETPVLRQLSYAALPAPDKDGVRIDIIDHALAGPAALVDTLHRGQATIIDPSDPSHVVSVFHSGNICSAMLSPDGSKLVTASKDRTARIWNAHTGDSVGLPVQHEKEVQTAAFSRDGRFVVTGDWACAARVVNSDTGSVIWRQGSAATDGPVMHAAFSPDDRYVVLGEYHGVAVLRDAANGKKLGQTRSHSGAVTHVAFSPDGSEFLTASLDRTVRRWDVATLQPIAPPLRFPEPVIEAAYSPGGESISVVTTTQDTLNSLVPHYLVYADHSIILGAARTRSIWSIKESHASSVVVKCDRRVTCSSLRTDGRELLIGTEDGTVAFYDPVSGRQSRQSLRFQGLRPLRVDPKHTVLAAIGPSDLTHIVSLSNGLPLPLSPASGDAAFSSDGRYAVLVNGQSGLVSILDASTGTVQKVAGDHRFSGPYIAPDNRSVITSEVDGRVQSWDAATGAMQWQLQCSDARIAQGIVSSDSRLMATCGWDNAARIWDVASKALLQTLRHPGPVCSVAFSPDGTRIVTCSEDRTARVWDTRTGQPISPPMPHPRKVNDAQFSRDGTMLYSHSSNGCYRLWDASAGRPLTSEMPAIVEEPARFDPDSRHLLHATSAETNGVELAPIVAFSGQPDDAEATAELYSAQHLDQRGMLEGLDAGEWRTRWGDWLAKHPAH